MSEKRRLNIVWSCRVRDHEHATEAAAAECIRRVTDFLDGHRIPPPATRELLAYWRDHWPPGGEGDADWLRSLLEAFDAEWTAQE